MRLAAGDEVTVMPTDDDAYILQFQRFATVSHVGPHADAVYVRLRCTWPPDREFGPIPVERILRGWRDSSGMFRSW